MARTQQQPVQIPRIWTKRGQRSGKSAHAPLRRTFNAGVLGFLLGLLSGCTWNPMHVGIQSPDSLLDAPPPASYPCDCECKCNVTASNTEFTTVRNASLSTDIAGNSAHRQAPGISDDGDLPFLVSHLPRGAPYIRGIITVRKEDFHSIIDPGYPLSFGDQKNDDFGGDTVVLMYGSDKALPTNDTQALMAMLVNKSDSFPDEPIKADDAMEHCQELDVISIPARPSKQKAPTCWAFVPGQPQSYHIQKWVRVADEANGTSRGASEMSPLRLVARGYDPKQTAAEIENGKKEFASAAEIKKHRKWLGSYLSSVDSLVEELKPVAQKTANAQKQVIAMAVNTGQKEIMLNFACAARSRGLSLKHVLVFVMDQDLVPIVEDLGMSAFYNAEFFGALPSNDPKEFGDTIFTQIVLAKFLYTHLLSTLGYDVLSQDVDVIWYKDPLSFFENASLADPNFDIYFQDDLNEELRMQPLRGNGGFYFVRHNSRTVAATTETIYRTIRLYASKSHQQTLAEVFAEHISFHGLKVKVFHGRETPYFPLGAHFHYASERGRAFAKYRKFMQKLVADHSGSYIFHMNWTKNKKEKVQFLQQIQEWYITDQCFDDSSSTLGLDKSSRSESLAQQCCSTIPTFRCYFRDMPSTKPCPASPAYWNNRKSWWDE